LDVRVTFDNTKQDHRLQATFKIASKSKFIIDGQFDVLHMNVDLQLYHGQQNFVGVYNPDKGISLPIVVSEVDFQAYKTPNT